VGKGAKYPKDSANGIETNSKNGCIGYFYKEMNLRSLC
jgi:hypothetical protein